MKRGTAAIGATFIVLLLWSRIHPKGLRAEEVRPAHILIDSSDVRGEISPLLFGASIEWVDNGNRIADPLHGGIRSDVIAAIRPLHIPVFRFPGGILADYYHWRDGIGPVHDRPRRNNPMDGTSHENVFGTDELIAFCRALDAQPLITANVGTGTLDETLAWQKYFKDRGLPVHLWEIGNEIYLSEPTAHASIAGNDSRIFKSSTEYATHFHEWAQALRSADPNARVGAIAGTHNTSSQHRDWMQVLAARAAQSADFVALHNSFAPLIRGEYNYLDEARRDDAYRAMFAQASFTGQDIDKTRRQLRDVNSKIQLAITEHFPLFGFGGDKAQLSQILDQSRTLASALFTASLFHTYMREGVWMATYNLTVSKWFGALLTDESSLVRTPTYYVFDLYRNHFGTQVVKSTVDSPEFNATHVGSVPAADRLPYLDVIASRDGAGHIYLAVVNRALKKSIPAVIRVNGIRDGAEASILTLTGPAANGINGEALSDSTAPSTIAPVASTAHTGENESLTLPPHSITIASWNTSQNR